MSAKRDVESRLLAMHRSRGLGVISACDSAGAAGRRGAPEELTTTSMKAPAWLMNHPNNIHAYECPCRMSGRLPIP